MPSKNLFALLVGINQYPAASRVAPLSGCHNDVFAFQTHLQNHYASDFNLHIKSLLDEHATYQNIISHLGEQHLLQAKENDTVIFLYSGHGAREETAPEFKELSPEGKSETLVCYDSRLPDGKDLADKELAVLLHRIANKGVHLVTIFDSCHSGSITRYVDDFNTELGARKQTYERDQPRPYNSYLDGYFSTNFPDGKNLALPNTCHIALSACAPSEKAFELKIQRGLFLKNFVEVLEKMGNDISYAELFSKCRAAMHQTTTKQNPQFQPYHAFNSQSIFLTGKPSGRARRHQVYFQDGTWLVECGAVHGVPLDGSTTFQIFKGTLNKGTALAKQVGIEKTKLELHFQAADTETFEAELLSIPTGKTLVSLKADAAGKKRLDAFLASQRPIYFEFDETINNHNYLAEITDNQFIIYEKNNKKFLRKIEGKDDEKVFQDAFAFLNHIANWQRIWQLQNTKSSLSPNDVNVEFKTIADGISYKEKNISLSNIAQNGVFQDISFEINIQNNSTRNLHALLLYMSQNYEIAGILQEALPIGEQLKLKDGLQIPEHEQAAFDNFKIIFSTERLEMPFDLDKLDLGKIVQYDAKRSSKAAALDASKGLASRMAPPALQASDWTTASFQIHTVKREQFVQANAATALANGGIVVQAHKSFKANLALSQAAQSKSLETDDMASLLQIIQQAGGELLSFGDSTRDLSGAPNVLELSEIEDDSILEKEPLQIKLNTQLLENEYIVPVSFDGEHILPVGIASKQSDGSVDISISHLPQGERKKSLFKALRLCFMKLVLKSDDLQTLHWVDYSQEKAKRKAEGIITKVQDANRILILLHGIIGDTQDMASYARNVCKTNQNDEKLFDLVLTFDYENLNTPIEETAAKLKTMLEDLGIKNGCNKEIVILAHSMGGLVSRYFIEVLDGKSFIKALVLAGTPNAGSQLAKLVAYRNYAVTILTFVLNTFLEIPFLSKFAKILDGSKHLTHTLAQMDYDAGGFLKTLEKTADPHIPYYIVAGNCIPFFESNEDARSLMNKILKLGGRIFYKDDANDIAVSTASIKNISLKRNPSPFMEEIACHHMNYFVETASTNKLTNILTKLI